jgi:glycosyltransferase involved in cell wall biosynthesis
MNANHHPRRPIRLLVNGLHSKSGGGITYLTNILPQLAADPDIEVHLCVNEDQRELMSAHLNSISVHLLSFRSSFWQRLLREQLELPLLARRLGVDVTFSPANYGPVGVPNSVILLRNALSVAFVERRPVKLMYWLLVYLGTALSLLVCRRAIAVSNYARRSAGGGLLHFVADRIAVIPHGVSGIFSPPSADAKRDDFLLAVSDIYVQKNLKNLLLAIDKLRVRHPGIRLKIAGRPIDEDYFASLQRLVSELELGRHVEFLGAVPQSELAKLYRTCAVFVFPSSVETFGNPLVEAMACGAPIASSNTAAMPEVVGDAALFFDPADVEGMAEVLDRMLKDHAVCHDLSLKAAQRAQEFSWVKTAQRTLGVIKEALAPG